MGLSLCFLFSFLFLFQIPTLERPVSWVPHPVLAEPTKANVWEKLVLKPVRLRPGGDHARREEHGQGGCQAQDQGGIDELRATHEQLCSILTHTPRQPARLTRPRK